MAACTWLACAPWEAAHASALPAPPAKARLSCAPVQEVFWQIDKDKSGTLEPTELRDALLKLGIPVPGEADFQARSLWPPCWTATE